MKIQKRLGSYQASFYLCIIIKMVVSKNSSSKNGKIKQLKKKKKMQKRILYILIWSIHSFQLSTEMFAYRGRNKGKM